MSTLRATARLQLNQDFTLDDASEVIDYYAALGISHIYTSPILTARPGSTHGYDVVDPTRINSELGGEAALRRFVKKCRAHGLGLIIDIVPNHMGVGGGDNPWWLHVLKWGPHSQYARWFDIDWNSPDPTLHGKILLPFLGDQYAQVLRSGDLRLQFDNDNGNLYFGYFSHRFPLAPWTYDRVLRHGGPELRAAASDFPEIDPLQEQAYALHQQRAALLLDINRTAEGRAAIELALASVAPDTAGGLGRLHRLLERQNYKLTWWRNAAEEINWRRFFEVSDLAGVRVELDDVFDATHALIFDLFAEGLIDGVRVDHVDGLADPAGYCRKLRSKLTQLSVQRPADAPNLSDGEAYFVVEKILTRGEDLRTDWQIDGTTGYEFMDQVGALMHSEDGVATLNKLWIELSGDNDDFSSYVTSARRQLLRENFVGEFAALTRAVHAVARTELETRDISLGAINRVLTELLVAFPVYRTYTAFGERSAVDMAVMETAVNEARRNIATQDMPLLDTLLSLFDINNIDPDASSDALALRQLAIQRFEQLTPPLAAKSVEDTAFYRYGRLLSRNEVGSDPAYFSSSTAEFHQFNSQRAQTFPRSLLATATHDHKRGEDVRARLAVLSECADDWSESVRRWTRLHTDFRSRLETEEETGNLTAPALRDEIMLYQMIVGAWPFELKTDNDEALQAYAQRLVAWQEKALREAKCHSSWALPNIEYEQACRQFLLDLLDREKNQIFLDDVIAWVNRIGTAGIANGMMQTLLRLTSPGVPDLYQGTEFWDFSLVDPDNRRDVDYSARRATLNADALFDLNRDQASFKGWHQHQLKQTMVRKVLALRKLHPDLFAKGNYQPLKIEGPLAERVIAFHRCYQQQNVVVLALRGSLSLLGENLQPQQTEDFSNTFVIPENMRGSYVDILSDRKLAINDIALSISTLLADQPFALLILQTN